MQMEGSMKNKKTKPNTHNSSLLIRNSTAEFLIFTSQAGEDGIEVRVQDENVWLTQKLIARLFDVKIPTINELEEISTIRKFLIVQQEGTGKVTAEIAKSFAGSEFDKYKPIQDKLYISDFDREMKKLLTLEEGHYENTN